MLLRGVVRRRGLTRKDYLGATTFGLEEGEVEEIRRRGEKHFRANNFIHDYAADDRA